MKRASLLVAAILVSSLVVVAPAHADQRVCQVQHHWAFSPSLTTTSTTGTITTTYQALCYRVGLAPVLYSGSGTLDYSGSCLLATISSSSGVIGALVGGAVGLTVLTGSNTAIAAYVLVPNWVCGTNPITDAYGVSVAVNSF